MKRFLFLAIAALFCFASATAAETEAFTISGSYYSKFNAEKEMNYYKNVVRMTVNTVPTESELIYIRKYTEGGTNNTGYLAKVQFTVADDGTCSYLVTYIKDQIAYTSTARYDNEAYPKAKGTVTAGMTIEIPDYFNVSTAANQYDVTALGGDRAEDYTYTIDGISTNLYVPVYAAHANINFINGHSIDEIKGNYNVTNAQLEVSCSDYILHGVTPTWKFTRVDSNTKSEDMGSATTFTDDIDATLQGYVGQITVTGPEGQDNTYGTNEIEAYPAIVTAESAYMGKTAYSFYVNGEKCHYFTNHIDLTFNYIPHGSFSRPTPSITGGGYRVWRNCSDAVDDPDGNVKGANNTLIYEVYGKTGDDDNSGFEYEEGVGSKVIVEGGTVEKGDRAGESYNLTMGSFAAKGETPTVNYTVQIIFKRTQEAYNPYGAPKRAAKLKDDSDVYYVVTTSEPISFTFPSDITTGVEDVTTAKQVSSVKYYNLAGQESINPFDGMNIVVTRYTDGTSMSQKVMK